MKLLDVPLHLQADGSDDCGPVSSAMILDYFGITSDQDEVIRKVPRCAPSGTSAFDNAIVLKEYGLVVEMVLAQPQLFDGSFIRSDPSTNEVKRRIAKMHESEKDPGKKSIIESLPKFIDMGSKLTLQIPSKEIIRKALDQNKLVWVSMNCAVLGPDEGGYHSVVIGGYRGNEFFVYNPWPRSRQKSWENADDIVFGIHAATMYDYDNGTILLVSKP